VNRRRIRHARLAEIGRESGHPAFEAEPESPCRIAGEGAAVGNLASDRPRGAVEPRQHGADSTARRRGETVEDDHLRQKPPLDDDVAPARLHQIEQLLELRLIGMRIRFSRRQIFRGMNQSTTVGR